MTAIATPRQLGPLFGLGFRSLYLKEVRRFLKVYTQTLISPIVTTLLYVVVFMVALGGSSRVIDGIPYPQFLAPGLVMMAIAQNAFANTSSSITIAKVQGSIVDLLMPPLSPLEITVALALGGVTRGVLVGLIVALTAASLVPVHVAHPLTVLYFGIMASVFLSLLGIAGGIWADKFDQIAAVTNFVVTPLSFLSGTFYSVTSLPGHWALVAHLNPFYYAIDGFRSGFTGQAGSPLVLGAAILLGLNGALLALCYGMLKSGYKLKP